jgi:hypothetical protein
MTAAFTRHTPRVFCGAKGRIEARAGSMRGTVRTISRGGTFFLSSRSVPVGETVELSIELPGVCPIKAVGEVRYHYRYEDGEGMGIRFLRLSGEDLALITQFVHARIDHT